MTIENPGGGKSIHVPEDPKLLLEYHYSGEFCGNCDLCCRNSVVPLYHGADDIDSYKIKMKLSDDPEVWILPQYNNGDCIYLCDNKCGIHEEAPALCKSFDCRLAYLHYKIKQSDDYSKEIIRKGKLKNRKHPLDISNYEQKS